MNSLWCVNTKPCELSVDRIETDETKSSMCAHLLLSRCPNSLNYQTESCSLPLHLIHTSPASLSLSERQTRDTERERESDFCKMIGLCSEQSGTERWIKKTFTSLNTHTRTHVQTCRKWHRRSAELYNKSCPQRVSYTIQCLNADSDSLLSLYWSYNEISVNIQ